MPGDFKFAAQPCVHVCAMTGQRSRNQIQRMKPKAEVPGDVQDLGFDRPDLGLEGDTGGRPDGSARQLRGLHPAGSRFSRVP
jgi:hypothetical protein